MAQHSVYLNALGVFLPGDPVPNDQMEEFLGKVGGKPSRARQRILGQNRIETRYYALDRTGKSLYRNSEMAALAIDSALKTSQVSKNEIQYLAAATTLSDTLAPGFASLVQGETKIPGCDVASFGGVCAGSVAALKSAFAHIRAGLIQNGVVTASEFASRHFRAPKFESLTTYQENGTVDFDCEFLRWMLSDGAGAAVLENRPNQNGLSLRIDWIDSRSNADRFETCMYAGATKEPGGGITRLWGDFPTLEEAVKAGTFTLRQDLDLLSHIVPLGVAHYLELRDSGKIPQDFDWFVCHYSSHLFRGEIIELLNKANAMIPEERWFTNLYSKGNVGSASIFVLLEELFHSGKLKPGQTIVCMVPESARFITSYIHLTVEGEAPTAEVDSPIEVAPTASDMALPNEDSLQASLIRRLMVVGSDFQASLQQVPIIEKLQRGRLTMEDYRLLLLNLRQQVMEGSRWISRAASNISEEHIDLRSLFINHSRDEHRDFQMLERDFVAIGGNKSEIQKHPRNIGSEALSAWMFHSASEPNPFHLVGAMFIIEGLGQHLASEWGHAIRRQLKLQKDQVSFLLYHGVNDAHHFEHLYQGLALLPLTPALVERAEKTAKVTARLYRLQLEELGNY